jgi:phosphoserine phosphatase RsbU/P
MSFTNELERYKCMLATARQLSSAMDLDALLAHILSSSQEVMAAEATSMFIPDLNTGEMVLHSAANINKEAQAKLIRIPKGEGIVGSVFESRVTDNIQDVQIDPRFYRKADASTGFITRAMITVPLVIGENCMGVIQALNPVGREHFDEVDKEIFEGYASLIASALLRLEAQGRELSDAKARQELELAREIQKSFLPPDLRILPTCQVRFGYFPAQEVGGDFYFVHPLDHHRTLMGLGDVSGKGVPAALTMARATAEIKGLLGELDEDLGIWVSKLNDILTHELHGGRFIGMTFLLTDCKKDELQICTAGQYPPLWSNSQQWNKAICQPQLPLGIMEGYNYRSEIFPLISGQIWLLYSDGITEARNSAGEDYTEEHFIADLPANLNGANSFKTAVESWKSFVGTALPHDDASFLMLDWRGEPPQDRLHLHCQTENLCVARSFIENWAKYAGFDDIVVGHIMLACDEATTNIYRYAYEGKPGAVGIEAGIEEGYLFIRMIDQGIPVELEKIKGRELDDLRPGGLGVLLLRQVFDIVEYCPKEVGTILNLRKKIP